MKYIYLKDEKLVVYPDKKLPLEKYGLKKPIAEITDKEYEDANGLIRIINKKVFIGYTPEEKAEIEAAKKRKERDEKLISTDKYLLSDFPIKPEELISVKEYRQTLRDLPEQKDWPYIEVPDFELKPVKK